MHLLAQPLAAIHRQRMVETVNRHLVIHVQIAPSKAAWMSGLRARLYANLAARSQKLARKVHAMFLHQWFLVIR